MSSNDIKKLAGQESSWIRQHCSSRIGIACIVSGNSDCHSIADFRTDKMGIFGRTEFQRQFDINQWLQTLSLARIQRAVKRCRRFCFSPGFQFSLTQVLKM
jgi:hypothetical protein